MSYQTEIDEIYRNAAARLNGFTGKTKNIVGMRDYLNLFGEVMQEIGASINERQHIWEKEFPGKREAIFNYLQAKQTGFMRTHNLS